MMMNSPDSNRLRLQDLADLLEAEGGDVGDRINLLPTRRRLHSHQHGVREEDQKNDVGQLGGGKVRKGRESEEKGA